MGGDPNLGSVIVGITGELTPDDIDTLGVYELVSGAQTKTTTYGAGGTSPIQFPIEVPFLNLVADTPVEVNLTMLFGGSQLTRIARTTVIAGQTSLLRLTLTRDCTPWLGSTQSCTGNVTCSFGRCRSHFVDPSIMTTYDPAWSTYDPCKPPGHGPPVLSIGRGIVDFTPITDGETIAVESGDQGGHHVWIALQTDNLRSDSVATIKGFVPALGLNLGPISRQVRLADDVPGGVCEVSGIRLQVDIDATIQELVGKSIEIDATVADPEGDSVSSQKTFVLAPP